VAFFYNNRRWKNTIEDEENCLEDVEGIEEEYV